MKELILAKYGEIALKGLNKNSFENLLIKNMMAETEPFLVVTGGNNYEGQLAMRQRQNGDIGYGYFKNDDYYYIFSEDE